MYILSNIWRVKFSRKTKFYSPRLTICRTFQVFIQQIVCFDCIYTTGRTKRNWTIQITKLSKKKKKKRIETFAMRKARDKFRLTLPTVKFSFPGGCVTFHAAVWQIAFVTPIFRCRKLFNTIWAESAGDAYRRVRCCVDKTSIQRGSFGTVSSRPLNGIIEFISKVEESSCLYLFICIGVAFYYVMSLRVGWRKIVFPTGI